MKILIQLATSFIIGIIDSINIFTPLKYLNLKGLLLKNSEVSLNP